jgi:hypothetical protein
MKDIFLHAIEVDLPRNDSRARGGTPEGSELICRSNDGEAVVEPIGMRQPHWRGLRLGFGALGQVLTSGWCQCPAGIAVRRDFLRTSFALYRSRVRTDPSLGFQPGEQRVGSRCSVDGCASWGCPVTNAPSSAARQDPTDRVGAEPADISPAINLAEHRAEAAVCGV